MPKLIVDVECGAKECGGCSEVDLGLCRRFGFYRLSQNGNLEYCRLPACIAAEADLTRLVKAVKSILVELPQKWGDGVVDGKVALELEADTLDALQAALAPFEERK